MLSLTATVSRRLATPRGIATAPWGALATSSSATVTQESKKMTKKPWLQSSGFEGRAGTRQVGSTASTQSAFFSSPIAKWFRRSGVPSTLVKSSAAAFCNNCADGIDVRAFFRIFDMPDTFFSWFLVCELHIWMMSVRLMLEEHRSGRNIRNAMIDGMWRNCNEKVKSLSGVGISHRRDKLFDLDAQFKAALMIYDHGVLGSDRDLANAVWRRFFQCKDNPDPEKIELLVRYIRKTLYLLGSIEYETLLTSKAVSWLPLEKEEEKST